MEKNRDVKIVDRVVNEEFLSNRSKGNRTLVNTILKRMGYFMRVKRT